ncbi:MAG: hypothetical protein DRO36_01550 [Candidatus Hecatellales archaeon]|nr:MAG: hypothetical protein DRO36_01550 [Candidatus Hecatellales archaeon]
MSRNKHELIQKLSLLLNEDRKTTRIIFKTLSLGKRKVSFKDIYSLALPSNTQKKKNLIKDAILAMCWWRILLPKNSFPHNSCYKSEVDEVYEIPACINYAFKNFYVHGTWDYKFAVFKYFEEIGEPHKNLIPKIVEDILREAYGKSFISLSAIRKACKKNGYPEDKISTLISELRNGGFINPFSTVARKNLKRRESMAEEEPVYELNKALFINYKR